MEGYNDLAMAAPAEKMQYEMMERLDTELDRYDRTIDRLLLHLQPVILDGPVDGSPIPEEVPYHELHRRLMRLERLNARLEDLRSRLRT